MSNQHKVASFFQIGPVKRVGDFLVYVQSTSTGGIMKIQGVPVEPIPAFTDTGNRKCETVPVVKYIKAKVWILRA